MYKTFFVALLLLAASHLSAQTVKNHSVNLDLLSLPGLRYKYEMPLSRSTTVGFHGGMSGSISYSSSGVSVNDEWVIKDDKWAGAMYGALGAELRYYYNLASRERKGKNTRANSANFLAMDFQYYTPAFYAYNVRRGQHIGIFQPYWGLRRVYRSNWLFEFHLGAVIGVAAGDWAWAPDLNLRVGYSF